MKKLLLVAMLAMGSLFTQGCDLVTVDGGEEAVFTQKPLFMGSGGVMPQPLLQGSTWIVWSTSHHIYDTKPVKVKEYFEDLTASDNVAIDFDMYLTLQTHSGKTPILHEKWGVKYYDNNIRDVFRKITRNEARTHTSIELRTDEKVINLMQDSVLAEIQEYLKKEQIPVSAIKAITGKVVPPEEVLAEAAKTAAQKQKKKTEAQRYQTEIARKQAEGARAMADLAYKQKLGMSNGEFIRLKELDIIEGKENVTVYMGVSPTPFKSM